MVFKCVKVGKKCLYSARVYPSTRFWSFTGQKICIISVLVKKFVMSLQQKTANGLLLVKCHDKKCLSCQDNPIQGCPHAANQQKKCLVLTHIFVTGFSGFPYEITYNTDLAIADFVALLMVVWPIEPFVPKVKKNNCLKKLFNLKQQKNL